jgi:hypothetical protein
VLEFDGLSKSYGANHVLRTGGKVTLRDALAAERV